jgi:hypothetical protein
MRETGNSAGQCKLFTRVVYNKVGNEKGAANNSVVV